MYHALFHDSPASASPSDIALIDGENGREMTREEVGRAARAFAHSLVHVYGVVPGDIVGIYSTNLLEYLPILLGILLAGATATTANPSYCTAELTHQLRHSSAILLITIPALLPNVLPATAEIGIPEERIILVSPSPISVHPVIRTFDSLIGPEEITPVRLTEEEAADRTAYIVYSSGTSGLPKGVELTHTNLIYNLHQTLVFEGPHAPGDRWAVPLPLYHAYGLLSGLHLAFLRGTPIVIIPKYDFVTLLTLISRYRITFFHVAPPIVLALAKHPAVDEHDISSLRSVLSAAAPLDGELAMAVTGRTGVVVRQAYGMSELSPLATLTDLSDPRPGSVGLLFPDMAARIIHPDGSPVNEGEEGELLLRGPNVMKGYFRNPEATRSTIDAEGYLHTGDVAVRDPDGHFHIVDRLKELIKYKGFQVAPAELEALLLSHPEVDDAAVIGVELKDLATEVPRAYVVRKPGSSLTADHIQAFTQEQLASHKHLRGGVHFLQIIPKSPSGKILRRILREQAKANVAPKL